MKKKKIILEKLQPVSEAGLRTFRGGNSAPTKDPITLVTWSLPEGNVDGDDGIKND
ncbi:MULTISPECIES: hypothetical protein [Sphingobacterium]|uniref:hypothetical protein n=1 Tax=Sphingobacterium TaxID=28453 RepID=UPI0024A62145|nr:hypothetical protein [Sphingobacterium thalpophilum]